MQTGMFLTFQTAKTKSISSKQNNMLAILFTFNILYSACH